MDPKAGRRKLVSSSESQTFHREADSLCNPSDTSFCLNVSRKHLRNFLLVGTFYLFWVALQPVAFCAQDGASVPAKPNKQGQFSRQLFDVNQAFNGWSDQRKKVFDQAIIKIYTEVVTWGSSDRLLIEAQLRSEYLQKMKEEIQKDVELKDVSFDDAVLIWRLLSLRKRGDLPKLMRESEPDRTVKEKLAAQDLIQAEIASRRSEEWFESTLDRILVDTEGRRFFESVVEDLSSSNRKHGTKLETPKMDLVRAAALRLRKSRRLRPELSAKLIDWDIEQLTFQAAQLIDDLKLVPQQPGVYLFRDATGYLYIGEAIDLRQRLEQHLSESDREQLATYLEQENLDSIQIDLHVFPSDSPGRTLGVRRAYESELIRSRKPRFNIRP